MPNETILNITCISLVIGLFVFGYFLEKNLRAGKHLYHKYHRYILKESRMNYEDVLDVVSGCFNEDTRREAYLYYQYNWGLKIDKKKCVLAAEMYYRYSHWLLHSFVHNIVSFPEVYPPFLRKRKYIKFGFKVKEFIKKYGNGERERAEYILFRALSWYNYIIKINRTWEENWIREHEDNETAMEGYYNYLEVKNEILRKAEDVLSELSETIVLS